jgi:hypothetical protein
VRVGAAEAVLALGALVVVLESLAPLAHLELQQAEVELRLRVLRVELDRFLQPADTGFRAPVVDVHAAEVRVDVGVIRRERQRLLEERLRFALLLLVAIAQADAHQALGFLLLDEIALLLARRVREEHAEALVRFVRVVQALERAPQERVGDAGFPVRHARHAEREHEDRVIEVLVHHLQEQALGFA